MDDLDRALAQSHGSHHFEASTALRDAIRALMHNANQATLDDILARTGYTRAQVRDILNEPIIEKGTVDLDREVVMVDGKRLSNADAERWTDEIAARHDQQ